MKHPNTHAVTRSHGPRPAGQPDECFYCKAAVGDQHEPTCVLRLRTVVLRYTFDVVVTVPEHWTEADILFNRTQGTWCASNAVDVDLAARKDAEHCWCTDFGATFVREATAEDEAKFELREELTNGR